MSNAKKKEAGTILWTDLTIENAETVKEFYSKVVGWKSEMVPVGDYNDFNMVTPVSGQTVAGICHARGGNTNLPPQWLVYWCVENIESSIRECEYGGGKILSGPFIMSGHGTYCVIQDPAGAVAALFEPEDKEAIRQR